MPRKAKPKTRVQSRMADKPFVTAQETVSFHSEAGASREASSLCAPHATPSGPNHVALRTCIHSDKSCQLSVESSSYT
jgi:hypothetical protein